MPESLHEVTRDDIIPAEQFARERRERRARLLPLKQLRRMQLGPYCTFYFENYDTMLFQIQEMLLIEKGGEEQLADELAAYNPLIPKGKELVATVMFEIDDPVRRARLLGSLGGIEEHFRIDVGSEPICGVPEGDVERSTPDGKTSSVHFLRFSFTDAQIAAFREPQVRVTLSCADSRYPHETRLGEATRAELAKDFAP